MAGVFNSAIGSKAGFAYSDAMKAKKDVKWTEENLHAYLRNPQEFIPNGKKSYPLDNAKERADLIAYLKQHKWETEA